MTKKLLEQKAKLLAEARSLIENAEKESRGLSAEEKAQNEKIFSDLHSINDTLALNADLEKQERSFNEVAEERAWIASTDKKTSGDEDEKKAAFNKFLRYGESVLNSVERRALSVGSDADGGYTVAPVDFQAKLIEQVKNTTFMRDLVDVLVMAKAKKLQLPKLNASPSDADWTTEVAAVSEDTAMQFGLFELDPNIATKLAKISNSLLRDSSIDIEALIVEQLGYKFGVTLEKGMLTGTGTTAPLGVFVASANGISTARDLTLPTGNATDITTASAADTFVRAKFQLKEGYLNGSSWIMNKATLEKVAVLKDAQGRYLLQEGLSAGSSDTIRGYPVRLSEYAPSTYAANAYVAVFGNFKYYKATMVQPFGIQRLVELYAGTNQTGFIGRMEADGKPALEEAFVRIKMSAT